MFSMICAAGILGLPETPKGIVCKAGNPPLFKPSKSRSWIKGNRRVGRYESYCRRVGHAFALRCAIPFWPPAPAIDGARVGETSPERRDLATSRSRNALGCCRHSGSAVGVFGSWPTCRYKSGLDE